MIPKPNTVAPITTFPTKIKTETGLSLGQTRHSQVLKFIETNNVNVLVDFGTNEGILLQKIQRGKSVKLMIGVDVDLEILPKAIKNLEPDAFQHDFQFQRETDQVVQLRHGSALQKYQALKNLNIDLITLVEVIEHIEEKYLQQLNENIFGYLRPTFVWMSTPNSEFNPIFNWEKGRKFRHDDHKFEWTRAEFQQYVDNVCKKYNYRATITGVGESFLEQHRDKGFCSQIAIFQNMDFSFDRVLRQKRPINRAQTLLKPLSPTKNPQIPLRTVYTHTNRCWYSNREHLIEVAVKQVISSLSSVFTPWSKFFQMLKKKTIFKKLAQHDDKWHYDYFIKDSIRKILQNQKQEIKCQIEGVLKIQKTLEGTEYEDEMNSQMDEEMSELNLGTMENELVDQKLKNYEDIGPTLYKYDLDSFPIRRIRNQTPQQNNSAQSQQNSSDQSQSLSESFKSSQYSSSSIASVNSWESIQMPEPQNIKKVPKRKRRNFKPRKKSVPCEQSQIKS